MTDYVASREEQLVLGDFDSSVIDELIERVEKAYLGIFICFTTKSVGNSHVWGREREMKGWRELERRGYQGIR